MRWILLVMLCACAAAPPSLTDSTPLEAVSPASERWEELAPGLERRVYTPQGAALMQLVALRIDPARYTFRVHYQPGAALSTAEWEAQLPDAVAFINANFFTDQYQILGLLVADGIVYGQPFTDRGGTFLVENGQPRIFSNLVEQYAGGADQAVQAFPMLVLDGLAAYNNPRASRRPTRRSLIGQDAQGRIVWMATPALGQSLPELSAYLAAADLELTAAFNLDGGGSTLLVVRSPGRDTFRITAFDRVPAVLAIYPLSS